MYAHLIFLNRPLTGNLACRLTTTFVALFHIGSFFLSDMKIVTKLCYEQNFRSIMTVSCSKVILNTLIYAFVERLATPISNS